MTDVLIITWDGGGNLPPALGIGREVVARGGQVRVLGHEVQRAAVEGAGFAFTPITRGRDYESAAPRGTIDGVMALTGLFADRRIADDARALLAEEPADLVMVDCLLWGTLSELGAGPVPVVSLVHSISDYFDRNARGPVGMLARLRGTDPVKAGSLAALTLVTTRRDFEPAGGGHPGAVHTGFVWQEVPVRAVPAHPRSTVLVSFSTTTFPGQAQALQRTLDGLAGQDVEVVVTTGAVDPAGLRAPQNARVVRRLDHAEVLPAASLVIGHGGHSTTARALSAGVPVLVMPMHPLMDQPAVGRAVTRLGAGRMLPKSAAASRIAAAVTALLTDEVARDAAQRIGDEARARDGAVVAVDALERVAGVSRTTGG